MLFYLLKVSNKVPGLIKHLSSNQNHLIELRPYNINAFFIKNKNVEWVKII